MNSIDGRRRQHDRIVERYVRGDQVTEIAVIEGVCVKTVRNVARRRGLPSRHPDQTARNRRILSRYSSGEPVREIASGEGVTPAWVRALAKRGGLPPRPARRYPIDVAAFDHPTAVGWWLIGLIAADGSMNAQRHRVSLSQRAADADVLRALYEYVGCPNRPLTVIKTKSVWSNGGEYREARIFSRQVCAALQAHGIEPRKSKTLKLSESAASQTAVWLGLLDGDGSAGVSRNHGIPRIDFFGTPALMTQCSAFWSSQISLQTGKAPSVNSHSGGLYKVGLYGTNAAIAARLMLASSSVSMRRKRRTLEQIAAYKRGPHWTKRPQPLRYRA